MFEVVGVVGDVANDLIVQKRHPAIYFPLRDYSQPPLQGVTLLLRAAPGADALGAARREIAAIDSNVMPFDARSMHEHIAEFVSPLRTASWTYGFIGIFGLVLAAVGLAGVTAYSVAQRAHEIGIRMALGARSRDVLRLVMAEGATLIAIGTAIGLALAWTGSRLLAAMNESVGQVTSANPSDPVVLFGSPVLLAAIALAACYLPARRSLRINPIATLRQE